jgi:8-amino-7-oxononanoate synthase
MNAKPITWPTVPKGKDRVRICLHAGNTKEDVDKLIRCVDEWARGVLMKENENERGRGEGNWRGGGGGGEVGGQERIFATSKL